MPFKFISNLLDSADPVIIAPYGGYVGMERIYATARVLEDEGITHAEEDRLFQNIWNSYKRFETDELRNVTLEAIWETGKAVAVSDDEGYMQLNTPHGLGQADSRTDWVPLTLRLLSGDVSKDGALCEATDLLMRPGSDSEFGVISDIDDTVLETGVASSFKWKLLVNSIMKNHYQRSPLEGAADFYQLLQLGSTGKGTNPIFYLSNSPYNIHGYLQAFLEKNNFPKGPLLLRDLSFDFVKSMPLEQGNKFLRVSEILNAFPQMPFVLIGDAAEHDIDIYLLIAKTFPERVSCIYLRIVGHRQKMARVMQVVENATGVEIKLVKESAEAIAHSCAMGFIRRPGTTPSPVG